MLVEPVVLVAIGAQIGSVRTGPCPPQVASFLHRCVGGDRMGKGQKGGKGEGGKGVEGVGRKGGADVTL